MKESGQYLTCFKSRPGADVKRIASLTWKNQDDFWSVLKSRLRADVKRIASLTWKNQDDFWSVLKSGPGPNPTKILQRKFYDTLIFKHSDWLLQWAHQLKMYFGDLITDDYFSNSMKGAKLFPNYLKK